MKINNLIEHSHGLTHQAKTQHFFVINYLKSWINGGIRPEYVVH
jgi:hypothetical protein